MIEMLMDGGLSPDRLNRSRDLVAVDDAVNVSVL